MHNAFHGSCTNMYTLNLRYRDHGRSKVTLPHMANNFRQKFCFEVLKFIECIMAPLKKMGIDPPVPISHFEM
jgi:hypothetical protein